MKLNDTYYKQYCVHMKGDSHENNRFYCKLNTDFSQMYCKHIVIAIIEQNT